MTSSRLLFVLAALAYLGLAFWLVLLIPNGVLTAIGAGACYLAIIGVAVLVVLRLLAAYMAS